MKVCLVCGDPILEWQRQRCSACRKLRYTTLANLGAKAHSAVAKAVKAGLLPSLTDGRTPCTDCAGVALEYDHRDYDLPLVVEPVCRRCNILRGPAIQPAAYIAQHPRVLRAQVAA